MSASYTAGKFKAWADGGSPLTTGRLYTYETGTTTFKTAYTGPTFATPCTYTSDGGGGLYIAMNARGEAELWTNGSYTMVLKTAAGATVWSADSQGNTAADQTFTPAGTGAVATNMQAKGRENITNYDKYSAAQVADSLSGAATLDVTTALQAALTGLSAGQQLRIIGANKISTMLTCAASNISIVLDDGASIIYNTPNFAALQINGDNCTLRGGKNGGFIGPAAWDGTNVAPTYGVIWVTGDNCTVDTRLYNVKKVGVWFKDVSDATFTGIIEGNYPTGSWTGTEVGHVGVAFDNAAANTGNFKLTGATIKSCVQGCLPANYGTGGVAQGFSAVGNIFEGCWNHGIYSITTNGAVITGNNFNRCQIPVVVTGDGNTVTGNTMYTSVATAGDARDSVGISVRDGSNNTITSNTIKGTLDAANTACITVQDVNGTSQLNNNNISGNTINITAGTGTAIRITGGTNSLSRNLIASNVITCPGNGVAGGAIALNGLPAGGNHGNKVIGNIINLTAQSEGLYATYQTASEFKDNTIELSWAAGAATNVYAARWFNGVGCVTDNNTMIVRAGNGTNITFYAYREDNAATGNYWSNTVNNVGGSATYAPAVLVANGGLSINQLGTGVPNLHAKIGSVWRRLDGGVGSTLYIKESGTDATGWTAK